MFIGTPIRICYKADDITPATDINTPVGIDIRFEHVAR
jgi:hypothetical protein